ncbi:MAG: hypothetical protein ABI644_02365 [Arenimonas sp.]
MPSDVATTDKPAAPIIANPPTTKPAVSPVAEPSSVPTPAPSSQKDELVILKAGESVKLSSSTSLDYVRVVSDSRCPVGTQCIWAGEITIELKLHSGSDEKTFTLSDRMKNTTLFDMQIELLSIGRDNVASLRVNKI